ncbi:hypothetical protein MM213_09895 [Belliella sp. R4-6]|uniref:Nitroreductase n=1 Tax=Belliella alkalica TaxID=1730871 RepID=A0ABS9VBJ4_9BACT|nr:hypothetical protein [Belliella alkalica]MCH7413796.1 hypothetical protein [Belliella alkalica]
MDIKTANDLMMDQWILRNHNSQEITNKEIDIIFRAGRQISNRFGKNPWTFFLVKKGGEKYQKLLHCLDGFNRKWANKAPYLGIALYKKSPECILSERNQNFYDTGAFMAKASEVATDMGVFIHQMAGFSESMFEEEFVDQKNYNPINIFALGRVGSNFEIEEKLNRSEVFYPSRKMLKNIRPMIIEKAIALR